MTSIVDKQNAVYIRGVVIAPDMVDTQNDNTPNREGIKKIFTNYLKHETDVQHKFKTNFNVHQLENTITTAPTVINGQDVPVGSWVASHMVLNDEIAGMIKSSELDGYSLGAIKNLGANDNFNFDILTKSALLKYDDLGDYDELTPLFISLVKNPSNRFTWEVMDYDMFLAKSNNVNGEIMSETQKTETEIDSNDEMVKVSVVERLLKPFLMKASTNNVEDEKEKEEKEAEVEVKEEVKTESEPTEEAKTEETKEDEVTNDYVTKADLKELPSLVAKEVINSMMELATQKPTSEALAKSTDAEEQVKEVKMESETKVEDKEVLTKASNKLDEMPQKPTNKKESTFLNSEKRDAYGRVRKYL